LADYYCTVAEVKDNTVANAISQAEWTDPDDIETRIKQAQTYIDGRMKAANYNVPFSKGTNTPPIINTICIWYSRYLILRDIYQDQSPMKTVSEESNKWKKDADEMMDKIEEGKMAIVNTSGALIEKATVITSTTKGINRVFTMEEIEKSEIDPDSHSSGVIGGSD